MAIKHIIVLFVETPRKFITAKIESFAVINLRGVSTNKTIRVVIVVELATTPGLRLYSYEFQEKHFTVPQRLS
jgi:hypothetical protein